MADTTHQSSTDGGGGSHAPGWYPDPAVPGQWRWFDGATWGATAPGGAPPPGGPPGRPSGPPSPSELGASAAAYVRANPTVAAGLVEGIRHRADGGVAAAVAAAAGTLAVVGVTTIVMSGDDPSPWLATAAGVVLVVAAMAGGFGVRTAADRSRWPLRPLIAGCTAVAIGGMLVAVTGFVGAVAEDSDSFAILWWPYALLAAGLLVVWLLPGVQGRPALLGGAALSAAWAATALVAVSSLKDRYRFLSAGSGLDAFAGPTQALYDDIVDEASLVAMGFGLVLVLASAAADHLRLHGISTPLLFAGVVSTVAGGFGVARDGSFVKVAIIAVLALVILAVGALSRRRATTWVGAALLAIGLIAAIAALFNDGDVDSAVVGVVLLGAAVVVAVAAVAIALWLVPLVDRYDLSRAEPRTDPVL